MRQSIAVLIAAGLASPLAAQDPRVAPAAFVNVSVVPMDSERVLAGQTVVVADGRITAVGPAGSTPVPDAARVIDGAGRYLVPGLADMHVHFSRDSNELLLYLANGVTTVRELSSYEETLVWRSEIAAGTRVGPRIYATGPLMSQGGGRRELVFRTAAGAAVAGPAVIVLAALAWRWSRPRRFAGLVGVAAAGAAAFLVGSQLAPLPDWLYSDRNVAHWRVGPRWEAQRYVRRSRGRYDGVKLGSALSPSQYLAILAAARAAGVHTVGHVPVEVGLEAALAGGLDELAHVYFLALDLQAHASEDSARDLAVLDRRFETRLARIADLVRGADVAVTPTISALLEVRQMLRDSVAFLARDDLPYRTPAGRRDLLVRMRVGGSPEFLADLEFHIRWGAAATAALARRGVQLAMGTDASPLTIVAGFSAVAELEELVRSGLTPYQALRTATAGASRVAPPSPPWGTIEVGRRADLILAHSNPLVDPAALRQPGGVMAAGRWYDRMALDSLLDVVARRRSGS